MALKPDAIAYPPRGLNRDEAARYVGVSPTKFDEMVADKRMPKPRRVDRRSVWDRFQLDAHFNDLPDTTRSWIDREREKGGEFAGIVQK